MPLSEGQNTITAIATDTEGNTDKYSITVNAVTTGNYIRLTANPESGISPLEVTLKIDGTFGFEASSISYRGPGGVEWLSSSVDEYRVRLTAEGIHTFTANAIGPDGNTIYQDTAAIIVQNRDYLDSLLKKRWDEMKAALMSGEIETALTYFVSKNRDKYRQIFTLLQSNLSSIATSMQPIQLIYIKNGIAKYRIRRQDVQGEITYYIYFEKDKDGIWRIRRY